MLLVKLITMFIAKLIEQFSKDVPIVHKVTMVLQHALVQLYTDELVKCDVSIGFGVTRVQACGHAQMTQQPTHCTALGEHDV